MWLLNWCAILCLLPWQVWTQAPGDFNEQCRTGQTLEDLHDFPDNFELLLDSYDYINLVNIQGLAPAWQTRDYDASDPSIGVSLLVTCSAFTMNMRKLLTPQNTHLQKRLENHQVAPGPSSGFAQRRCSLVH